MTKRPPGRGPKAKIAAIRPPLIPQSDNFIKKLDGVNFSLDFEASAALDVNRIIQFLSPLWLGLDGARGDWIGHGRAEPLNGESGSIGG